MRLEPIATTALPNVHARRPVQFDVSRDGAVLLARFSNPPYGYMDDQTELELEAILDSVEADSGIRTVVFCGTQDKVFIRHYDVRTLETRGAAMRAKGLTFTTDRPVPPSRFLRCLDRIEALPVAFIAAINGVAMGGGFELALACDFRLAQAGDYSLGLPEINIGLLPGAGGTQRLTRLIGQTRALEFMLLGKTFDPATALALGILTECVRDDVLARSLEIARELSNKHPKAFSHIKRLVRSATDTPLELGLANERTLFCDLMVDDQSLQLMNEMNRGKRDIQTLHRDSDD